MPFRYDEERHSCIQFIFLYFLYGNWKHRSKNRVGMGMKEVRNGKEVSVSERGTYFFRVNFCVQANAVPFYVGVNLQASYRAYKVRREKGTVSVETDGLLKTPSDSSIRSIDQVTRSTDHLTPSKTENLEKAKVTFGGFEQANVITGDPALATRKHGDSAQFKVDTHLCS